MHFRLFSRRAPIATGAVFTGLFCVANLYSASGPVPQPPVVTGTTAAETVTLPEFRVETNQDNTYLATETTSGTRIAQKIIDLPYSVQSIPSEFFNDFMLFDIDEMSGYISDVKPADSAGAGNGGARLRGFGMPNYRNGFAITQQPDSNNVDRVEILKGPSSGIYGETSPGGVMNFVTKKPQPKPAYSLEAITGSHNYQKYSGYATGPIRRNLYYRVDATHYDFNRPTDWWFNRTTDISGGLTYKFSSDTSLTAEFAHTQRAANPFVVFTRYVDRSNRTRGLVYTIPEDEYPGLGVRLTKFNQAGPYNRYERYNHSSYLTFQHRFSPSVSLQSNLSYTNRHFRRFGPTSLGNWSLITNNWTGTRSAFHQRFNYEQIGAQTNLAARYGSPSVRHHSHVGFDWIYLGQKMKTWQLSNTAAILAGLAPGTSLAAWQKPNPHDLDFLVRAGQPQFDSTTWPMVDGSTNNLYTEDFGLFYNHMLSLMEERLVLMATVRGDRYSTKRQQPLSTIANFQEATSDQTFESYSTGVSYKIIGQSVVAYGSYGSSFNLSPTVDRNTGEVYGNTEAKGGEVGLKGIVLNGSFSYTVAAFSVRQDNEAVNNPDNPGGSDPLLPVLAPGGSSKSTGIGIDVSGRLTRNLSLLGNMSWLDSRTVKNLAAPTTVGQRITNSGPARKGSVAGTYGFTGRLKGLRAGLTYYYSTENIRFYGTATADSVYLPSNSYWGGMISYSWKVRNGTQLRLHLAVTDIFSQQTLTDNAFAPAGAQWKLSTGFKF
jgi:outer membrane receptor protein involved in Fe transport